MIQVIQILYKCVQRDKMYIYGNKMKERMLCTEKKENKLIMC